MAFSLNETSLKEYGTPDEEEPCSRCETNWSQRLANMVERTRGEYTTAYPCMTMDGFMGILFLTLCAPTASSPRRTTSVAW